MTDGMTIPWGLFVGVLLAAAALWFGGGEASADPTPPTPQPDRKATYQTVDGHALVLEIFVPEDWRASDHRTAIVCFHGGGWTGGAPSQFYRQGRHFADRGAVVFSAQYRLADKNGGGVTVGDCIGDALAALSYVHDHAPDWGVDPGHLVVMGGSAGGHLAAETGLLAGVRHTPMPAAMVLLNPVLDVPYHAMRVHARGKIPPFITGDPKAIAPVAQVHADPPPACPPTVVMQGVDDDVVLPAVAGDFVDTLKSQGVRAELVLFPGVGHGFFNLKPGHEQLYARVLRKTDAFLTSLGLLAQPTPTASQAP